MERNYIINKKFLKTVFGHTIKSRNPNAKMPKAKKEIGKAKLASGIFFQKLEYRTKSFNIATIIMTEEINEQPQGGNKRKEIFTYEAPWTIYTMAWRRRPEGRFQIALGSFLEEYANQFQIVTLIKDEVTGDGVFKKLAQFDHPYPATKSLWAPANANVGTKADLLATSGDYLRIWNVDEDNQITMKGVLNNNKHAGKLIIISHPFSWKLIFIFDLKRILCTYHQF